MALRRGTLEDLVAMRVLVTGHAGYIGSCLIPLLIASRHEVTGLDTLLFAGSTLGDPPPTVPTIVRDIRDATARDLEGFDAIIHLAGLSNDPMGDIDLALTDEINHRATVRLAHLAADCGVRRFLYASTCSVYGEAGTMCTESSPCHPVTSYARAKLAAETAILAIASPSFEPVALRFATAYGFSGRIRMDLVVNNLTAWAVATGKVHLKSDGSAWRPLLDVGDAAAAILAVLHAPAPALAQRIFNVCAPEGNHRVIEVARRVESLVPGSTVHFSGEIGPDPRDYRVDGRLFLSTFPDFRPRGTLDSGISGLVRALRRWPVRVEDFEGPRFRRVDHLLAQKAAGLVDATFRPAGRPAAS
jgi:nucleoside-diphosphate-sugar epimerase